MKKNLTGLYEQAVYEQTVESLLEAPERIADRFSELIIHDVAEFVFCNGHVSGEDLAQLIKERYGVKE